MIKDAWEEIRIILNSRIVELCNQGRYDDARHMENVRDIVETALKMGRYIP